MKVLSSVSAVLILPISLNQHTKSWVWLWFHLEENLHLQTSQLASTSDASAKLPLSFTLHLKPCVTTQNEEWASVSFLSLAGTGAMCSLCDQHRVINMTAAHFVLSYYMKWCLQKRKTSKNAFFYHLGSRQVHEKGTVGVILNNMNFKVSTKVNVQASKFLDGNHWVRMTGTF